MLRSRALPLLITTLLGVFLIIGISSAASDTTTTDAATRPPGKSVLIQTLIPTCSKFPIRFIDT